MVEKKEKPTGEKNFKEKPMWLFWNVTIKLRDELVGGWPKSKSAEDALLDARGLSDLKKPDPDLSTLTDEEKAELAEQAVKKSWTGFHSDENGLFVESRCVKAMMKEAGNILKGMIGIKNLKSKIAERIHIDPHRIPLYKKEPDGTIERPIHVMTARGPRTSLVIADYIMQPELTFTLRVLNDGLLNAEKLRFLLDYAQENGLGKDRSQDFGKFDIVSFELQASEKKVAA